MPKDRFQFSRLLSGKRKLTVQEKEAVLDRVLFEIEKEKSAPVTVLGLSRFGFKRAAAVVSAVLLVPLIWLYFRAPADTAASSEPFGVRGDEAPGPRFSVNCVGKGRHGSCRHGDKLVFRLSPPRNTAYFGAFARHLSDDRVVWYFPGSAGATSVPTADRNAEGVLPSGIQIGPEHPAGTYRVFGVYSPTPMTREKIKAKFGDRFEIKSDATGISSVTFSVEP